MEILYEHKTKAISYQDVKSLSPIVHLHKELEVMHVLEGKTIAYADSNSYVLHAGDTFVAFPNQVHYYKHKHPGSFIVLIFSANILFGCSNLISQSIPDTNLITAKDAPALSDLFRQTRDTNTPYRDLMLNGYINIIMGQMLPHLTLSTNSSENNSALYNIVKFCSRNFKDDITLDTLAKELHLSKYYISHLINQRLGQNFNEYLNNIRISEACLLLKETDSKIADISENVGFGALRSFNRAFKNIMGISPTLYREQNTSLQDTL